MSNFTATFAQITSKNPGQQIQISADIAAADASNVGIRNVRLRVQRVSDLATITNFEVQNQSLSLTPLTIVRNYTLPANLTLGQYQVFAAVHPQGAWSPWLPVTQTHEVFDVVAVAEAPPPPSPTSLVKISGDDQGGIVNQMQPAPMVAQTLNADGSPFVGATVAWTADGGTLSEASTVTDSEGKAAVTLTHPANVCTTTVTASVGSLSVAFTQTCRMVLYGTHSPKLHMLRPNGDGFLPDDGREYTLIEGASDEFDGTSLNHDKWWRRHKDNQGTLDKYGDELQRYIDNHIVSDGSLKFPSQPRPDTVGHAPSASGIAYPLFDSSMIRSRTTFKYGFIEARMKLPPGLGVWPALWLLAQGNAAEIDILEYVRNGVNEHASMAHGGNVHRIPDKGQRWHDDNYNTQYKYWRANGLSPTYFTDDRHTFSMLWEPDQIIYYIDGCPVVQRKIAWQYPATGGPDAGLASVIINFAIGGSWATNGWTTAVPTDVQTLEADYVRVYQRSDSIITGISPV